MLLGVANGRAVGRHVDLAQRVLALEQLNWRTRCVGGSPPQRPAGVVARSENQVLIVGLQTGHRFLAGESHARHGPASDVVDVDVLTAIAFYRERHPAPSAEMFGV